VCQIRKLPAEIGCLCSLTSLELQHNRLTTLPGELEGLTRLIKLNLAANQLSQLPPGFSNLCKLSTLVLSNNEFDSLPKELLGLRLLRLSLDSNPFEQPLSDEIKRVGALAFVRQGTQHCQHCSNRYNTTGWCADTL
jgi:Leucine-rich repeat (LRR) protein